MKPFVLFSMLIAVSAAPEYRENGYGLKNIVTGASAEIELPTRDGWRLVKMAPDEPGTYVNANQNVRSLWISNDRQLLAMSDSHGENFRELKPATDSDDPTKDYLNDPFWSIDPCRSIPNH